MCGRYAILIMLLKWEFACWFEATINSSCTTGTGKVTFKDF